jgi:drug/metabolite transporter (DMT)-like permease
MSDDKLCLDERRELAPVGDRTMADDGQEPVQATTSMAPQIWDRRTDQPLLGILLIVVAMSIFPVMDATAKILSVHLNVLQVVWLRYAVQFLFCLPMAATLHPRALLRPQAPRLQMLRGVMGLCTIACFVQALATQPLADTLAVSFISPFIITALSPFVLGEQVGPWRWAAVVAGFIGVLTIIQPGFATFTPGIGFALAAGVSYAAVTLVTRRVAGSDPAVVTMTLMGFFAMLAGAIFLPFVWRWPSPAEWGLILIVGGIGTFCQLLIVLAYEKATTAELAPFSYVEVVSAAFVGLIMFGDWPIATTWLGIGIVVASGLVIAWREAIRHRARYQARPAANK